MSRLGASAGALTFGFAGAIIGNAIGAHVRGRSVIASGVTLNSDEEQLGTGVGGVLGILVGAAIGAGSPKSSQVGTAGVGASEPAKGRPRIKAAVSSAFGMGVGAAGGWVAGTALSARPETWDGRKIVPRKLTRAELEWPEHGAAIGGALGGIIGAALGVPSEPKQVGTAGVGMYLGSNEAFP